MSDLRALILGNRDGRQSVTTVPVPEWECEIGLRRLTLQERLTFEAANGALEDLDRKRDGEKYNRWMVRYVIATACVADGTPLFKPDDELVLHNKSATAIERLVLAALKMNNMTAEEIANMGKASVAAPNGASPSVSPVTSA